MDIIASNSTSNGNWGVFPNEPFRLWLPENFKKEFGIEFKVKQTDTSVTVSHKSDIITEQ